MICSNCGMKNEGQAKFCGKCGTGLSGNEINSEIGKVDESTSVNGQNFKGNSETIVSKNNKKSNSKVVVAIILAIVAIIGIFIGVSDYKSQNVSKKVIEKDFIGNEVSIGSMKIDINKNNLKSIKLEEKVIEREFGIRTYDNKGIIILEDKNYKMELPVRVSYIYNEINKNWELGMNLIDTYSEDVKIEIKEKISEDIVKETFIDREISGVKITEEVAKGLVIDSMEEWEHGTVINAYSTLENRGNFVTKKMSLEASISFDGEKWSLSDGQNILSENIISITQPLRELTTDEIKKDLLMLVENKSINGYKGFNTITVSLDDISDIKDLKVDSITYNGGVSYIITGNIEGKRNNLTFDGVIKITVSENGYVNYEANFNKVSVENPTEEQIKDSVSGKELSVWIDKNYTYHLITDNDKETFKVNEIFDYKDDAFVKHVYANMTYTEKGRTITSDLIYMKMYYDTRENKWEVSDIMSSTDTSFNRYYGKDVINKN